MLATDHAVLGRSLDLAAVGTVVRDEDAGDPQHFFGAAGDAAAVHQGFQDLVDDDLGAALAVIHLFFDQRHAIPLVGQVRQRVGTDVGRQRGRGAQGHRQAADAAIDHHHIGHGSARGARHVGDLANVGAALADLHRIGAEGGRGCAGDHRAVALPHVLQQRPAKRIRDQLQGLAGEQGQIDRGVLQDRQRVQQIEHVRSAGLAIVDDIVDDDVVAAVEGGLSVRQGQRRTGLAGDRLAVAAPLVGERRGALRRSREDDRLAHVGIGRRRTRHHQVRDRIVDVERHAIAGRLAGGVGDVDRVGALIGFLDVGQH